MGPAEIRALFGLGATLAAAGQLGDARAIWEGLASLRPRDPTPLRFLAWIAARERRLEDAIRLATAALERGRQPEAALIRAEALLGSGRVSEAAADLDGVLADAAAPAPVREQAAALRRRLGRRA